MAGTLEIILLRTFTMLVDDQSITHVARRLHRTQPAVSMQLRRLEIAAGKMLFDSDRGQELGLPACGADRKRGGELWRFSRLRQRKYLNNTVEQDHRRIKRLVRPGLGFRSMRTAKWTLAGYEAIAMVGKGQVYNIGGRDMRAQAVFVAGLIEVAARRRHFPAPRSS